MHFNGLSFLFKMVSKAMSWEEIQRIWDPIEEGKILKIFSTTCFNSELLKTEICAETPTLINLKSEGVNFFVVL